MLDDTTRRRFVQLLLASPVAARLTGTFDLFGQEQGDVIASAQQALDVFDFEKAARVRLPPAHFGYHGGRAEDSGRSTIDSLGEVVQATRGRVPVLLDGGVRRGADIFKALALGATAVGIGRPYCWGLAAFGQEGVETVLDILRGELLTAMRQAGTRSISEIDRSYVVGVGRG